MDGLAGYFRKGQDGIVCLTNGRQMMRAFALYAQDHDGLLAGNEDASGAPQVQQLFLRCIRERNAWRRTVRGWTAIMDTPEGPVSNVRTG